MATVYDATGDPLFASRVPIYDKLSTTGLFRLSLFLDERFSEGEYIIAFSWKIGGTQGGMQERFTILPGGAGSGQVIALRNYETPHANFLVQQRTSGRIYKGRNPRA